MESKKEQKPLIANNPSLLLLKIYVIVYRKELKTLLSPFNYNKINRKIKL